MRPRLKVRQSRALDVKTCSDFINHQYGGVDFGAGIVFYHRKLGAIRNLPAIRFRREMADYIDDFYARHQAQLKRAQVDFDRQWRKIERNFFHNVNRLFSNHPWPKGEYVCYLSIFPCNPRFLENETFQVFYRNVKDARRLMCHEMLHFIFYGYWKRYAAERRLKLNDAKVWKVSEIFNALVLNTKTFQALIRPSREFGYPDHQRIIKTVRAKSEKFWKVDDYLDKILSVI